MRVPRRRPLAAGGALARACSRTRSTSRSPASTTHSCSPNNHPSRSRAARPAGRARSSASTPRRSSDRAKRYLHATPYRLEEEKMAVVVQKRGRRAARRALLPRVLGRRALVQLLSHPAARARGRRRRGGARARTHGGRGRALPARSARATRRHILQLLLGRGHPRQLAARVSGRSSSATTSGSGAEADARERASGSTSPSAIGTLDALGCTYAAENHAIYDGLSRAGRAARHASRRCSSTACFPLADMLSALLDDRRPRHEPAGGDRVRRCGSRAIRTPGARVRAAPDAARCVLSRAGSRMLDVEEAPRERLLCRSRAGDGATAASTACTTWSWSTSIASIARKSRARGRGDRAVQRRAGSGGAGPTLLVGVGRLGLEPIPGSASR